jgi:hypothetical protein
MAIIACWECGKDISGAATFCPQCGAPAREQAAAAMVSGRGDELIYESYRTRVTTATALIGGRTYAVNGITAVHIARRELGMGKLILAAVLTYVAYALSALFGVLSAILAVIAVASLVNGLYRPYFLVLKTSAGDTTALESRDVTVLSRLRDAIETAIKQRG